MTLTLNGLCNTTYCPADPLKLDKDFDKLLQCELGSLHREAHMVKVGPGLVYRWKEFEEGGWLQRVTDE